MNENEVKDVIYIELNNWVPGEYYPDEEPFLSWMEPGNDKEYELPLFLNEKFVKDNKLCVGFHFVDMSLNFCITAKKDFIDKMCPRILNDEFKKFIRNPEIDGNVYGNWGCKFLNYKEENIGIHFYDLCKNEKGEMYYKELEEKK